MPNESDSREYQVALEFHGDDLENFDRVMSLATKLGEELESGEVDGHDVGGGIVNIFIDTREPRQCFTEAMQIIRGLEPKPLLRAIVTKKKKTTRDFGPRTILHLLS